MFKHAGKFLMTVAAVLICTSSASAAIFETQALLPEPISPVNRLHSTGGRAESPHPAGSLDHGANLQFPLTRVGFVRYEDLLWMASGDASLFSLQPVASSADAVLYRVEADKLTTRKADHDGAVRAPAGDPAPETWAVILIGAGLVWFQLRRRNRHGAIHFTSR